MAAFDGIPLLGPAGTGGAVLYLRHRPTEGGTARLEDGVEVKIREGVLAAVVRGVPGSDFDTVMGLAPELLNRGLDVFALTGFKPPRSTKPPLSVSAGADPRAKGS